jgi:hypothetical protein
MGKQINPNTFQGILCLAYFKEYAVNPKWPKTPPNPAKPDAFKDFFW